MVPVFLTMYRIANGMRQTSLQPEQAVNVLDDRVAIINKINLDIADFLQVSQAVYNRIVPECNRS